MSAGSDGTPEPAGRAGDEMLRKRISIGVIFGDRDHNSVGILPWRVLQTHDSHRVSDLKRHNSSSS